MKHRACYHLLCRFEWNPNSFIGMESRNLVNTARKCILEDISTPLYYAPVDMTRTSIVNRGALLSQPMVMSMNAPLILPTYREGFFNCNHKFSCGV